MKLINRFDQFISGKVLQLAPAADGPMRLVTWFGSTIIILLVCALGFSASLYSGDYKFAADFVVCLMACGGALIAKGVFRRPRPQPMLIAGRFNSYSFPSGHSFSSLLTYGFLLRLASLEWSGFFSSCALLAGSLLIFTIGVSRIYLRAHYASDVLAGWVLASLTLVAIISVFSIH